MPDQATTQLTVRERRLTAGDALLTCFYPAGDCDTCPWPMVSEYATPEKLRERLARALFDAREVGDIPGDCTVVLLPDGTPFEFDQFVR
jgi:hypothetical protein